MLPMKESRNHFVTLTLQGPEKVCTPPHNQLFSAFIYRKSDLHPSHSCNFTNSYALTTSKGCDLVSTTRYISTKAEMFTTKFVALYQKVTILLNLVFRD